MNLKTYLEEHVDTIKINKNHVDFHKNPKKLNKINNDAPAIIVYNGDIYTIGSKNNISFDSILEWLKIDDYSDHFEDNVDKFIAVIRNNNSNEFIIDKKKYSESGYNSIKPIFMKYKKKFEEKNPKLSLII